MPVSASMASANVFIDDFNRADGVLGSNYDTVTGTSLRVFSQQVYGGNSEPSANAVKPSVATFSPNHESQITYTAIQTSDLAGPAVRLDPVTKTGYVLHIDGLTFGGRTLSKLSGSTITSLGGPNLGGVTGDTFKLSVSGSRLSVYQNGRLVDSRTDTTYPTGQPGMYYNWTNIRGTRMDNFIAADIPTTNAKSLCIVSQTPVGKLIVGSQ
jgi:hypothetical protein